MLDTVLSLVLGLVVAVVAGRALQRAGRPFLDDVFPDGRVADSAARLLGVLYYLLSAGAAFLISTARMPAATNWLAATSMKVGAVLLLVGVLHGATLAALLLIKNRRQRLLAATAVARRRTRRPRDAAEPS